MAFLHLTNVHPSSKFFIITVCHKCCSCHDATAMVTIGKDKHFSLGLDLQELDNLTDADRINFFNDFERLLCRTLTFPLVTVAAVNGRYICRLFTCTNVHVHVPPIDQSLWNSQNLQSPDLLQILCFSYRKFAIPINCLYCIIVI